MKTSEDSQGDVRDAALKVLGICKGRLGETSMSKFLSDLNPQKLQKVTESAANVKPSKYDRPLVSEKKAPPPAAAAKKAPAKKAPVKKESAKEETPIDEPYAENNNAFDEQPIKSGGFSNTFDDMPIGGGNKNMGDELPIGGKSGYNLDNLDEDAFGGGGGFGNPPPIKKKPPPKAAVKKPPVVEEEKVQSEDVLMNDDTMMSPKKVEVKKPPAK